MGGGGRGPSRLRGLPLSWKATKAVPRIEGASGNGRITEAQLSARHFYKDGESPDAHDIDGVADHVGRALLAFGPLGVVAVPAAQVREQVHQREGERTCNRSNPRPGLEGASSTLGNSASK